MSPSLSEVTTVDIEARARGAADVAVLRASGSVLRDPGWLRAHGETADDETPEEGNGNGGGEDAENGKARLPQIVEGETLDLVSAQAEGHETQPPPRFGEASLVKFLEENGIGRPSTYAEILRKIEDREYVRKRDRRFIPTPLGRLVVDLMLEGFDDFFETGYTARMEEELDEVEEGSLDWRKALADFDGKFVKARERAKKKMVSLKAGLPLAEVRRVFVHFRLPNDPGDTLPEERRPAEAPNGEGGALHRVRRLPRLQLHRRYSRNRGGPDRRGRPGRADLRRVRKPDEAPDGALRLRLPRLHRLPGLPQHRPREGGRRKGRGASRRPDRRDMSEMCSRSRHETWPVRRLRRLLQLARLPVPPAKACDDDGREVP